SASKHGRQVISFEGSCRVSHEVRSHRATSSMRSSWVFLGLLQLVRRSGGTTTSAGYPSCTGTLAFIGDGYCDESLNNALCGFDEGDCCECDCSLDIVGE
ncbi:unnamed protein product, partial [Scytosiphon promiscuus]